MTTKTLSWTRRLLVLVSVIAATLAVTSPAYADETAAPPGDTNGAQAEMSASDTAAAVENVDAVPVADIKPAADGAQVAKTDDGTTVSIPKDPEKPTTITSPDGTTVGIGLATGAKQASDAKVVGDTVVYEGVAKGVDAAAQAVEGGGRQLVTIANPETQHEFRFAMTVPAGGSLKEDGNGGIAILDGNGVQVSSVSPAWAKAADGVDVPSRYRIEGTTLVQVVDHDASFQYPITADPAVGRYVKSSWFTNESRGLKLHIDPTTFGRYFARFDPYGTWNEAMRGAGKYVWSQTSWDQLLCHEWGSVGAFGYYTGGIWEIEYWQPNVGFWKFVDPRIKCNMPGY